MTLYTKRHYEDIAKLLDVNWSIGYTDPKANQIALVEIFAQHFAMDNPLFDKKKFLKACGVEE